MGIQYTDHRLIEIFAEVKIYDEIDSIELNE